MSIAIHPAHSMAPRAAYERNHSHPELDECSLAAALARLFERRHEHVLRVRVLGFGTLYLAPAAQRYGLDFAAAELPAALETHRYVLTTLAADDPALAGVAMRPFDEVSWCVALFAGMRSAAGQPHARYRMTRWPDFARLFHRPFHIPCSALLARAPMSAAMLAHQAGIELGDARNFLHACLACGYVESADEGATTDAARSAQRAHPPGASLFERLWRRLLG